MTVVRIGTRGSELARTQSALVARELEKRGATTELVVISTEGDRSSEPLASLGGAGVFVAALREALLDGRVDVAVHSLKDLPTAPAPGLSIGAVPKRADPRDGLCARDGLTLESLPPGARVGTGSPRRVAQLRSRRPDLEVVDLRGNVDSRLARVASGELDAVVLAVAGLDRIGRLDAVTDYLDVSPWPTAPGQGALAVEVRSGEERLVSALDHKTSRTTVEAERRTLALLEAGCSAPVGAHAVIDDGLLFLSARVYGPEHHVTSSHALYVSDSKDPAGELADRVAKELFDLGAAELMAAAS